MELTSVARSADDPPYNAAPQHLATDSDLLTAYVESRDTGAFELLLARHGPMVMATCRRILRNDHDADDAFQATFLVLARKSRSISPREMVANWLYGVAFRCSLKVRTIGHKRATRERHFKIMPELPVQEQDPARQDLLTLLDGELNRLPDKYRLPIILCDLEGLTHGDAARQLGWPVGTLSGRLWRARKRLAERITRRGLAVSVASLATFLSANEGIVEVPAALFKSTAKVAGLVATDSVANAESLGIATIAQGVIKTMWFARVRVVAIWILPCVVAALGLTGWSFLKAAPPSGESAHPPVRAVSGEAAKRKALDELQGDWLCIAAERKGSEVPAVKVKASELLFSISGEAVTLDRATAAEKATAKIRLDPSADPKELDLVDFPGANGKKLTALGIYDLSGDTLKFCYGTQRPKQFKTSQDATLDERLYVFQRQKKPNQ